MAICQGQCKDGTDCKNRAQAGQEHCWQHGPKNEEWHRRMDRVKDAMRRGASNRPEPAQGVMSADRRVRASKQAGDYRKPPLEPSPGGNVTKRLARIDQGITRPEQEMTEMQLQTVNAVIRAEGDLGKAALAVGRERRRISETLKNPIVSKYMEQQCEDADLKTRDVLTTVKRNLNAKMLVINSKTGAEHRVADARNQNDASRVAASIMGLNAPRTQKLSIDHTTHEIIEDRQVLIHSIKVEFERLVDAGAKPGELLGQLLGQPKDVDYKLVGSKADGDDKPVVRQQERSEV